MVWEGKLCCEEFDLHAGILNLASGFLATEYMSFLQSPGTYVQNMRPNRLCRKSSMNTMLFVNATVGFSENLFFNSLVKLNFNVILPDSNIFS